MKKIIAIMLAALMLLSLAACGKTTTQNQDTSADTVSGGQTASTAVTKRQQARLGKLQLCLQPAVLATKPITIPSMPA